MKKLIFSLIILFLLPSFGNSVFAQTADTIPSANTAILFFGNGCPHCAKVEQYIQENSFNISIEQKEIYANRENADLFNSICTEEAIDMMDRGVPFLYTENGDCIIGDTPIISYLESKKIESPATTTEIAPTVTESTVAEPAVAESAFAAILPDPDADPTPAQPTNKADLSLPVLIGGALVDSINPCEFAVLLILMTTILASGSKKRALLSGLAYSASIFISYFLMGLGLYSVISNIGTTSVFMKVIGVIAILLGLFNLKDFLWYGKLFIMEVPMSWRPRLKSLVRSITGPISAFLIGFLVSLFLLPCTSGPYIVILGMLGHQESFTQAVLLLLLYNLIFVLPMLAITIGVYFGINVEKAEETRNKNLKILHLLTGVIMLAMGVVLLLGYI